MAGDALGFGKQSVRWESANLKNKKNKKTNPRV